MRTPAALGDRFGRLTLVEILPNSRHGYGRQWGCRCDCGARCDRVEAAMRRDAKRGVASSCGCVSAAARGAYWARRAPHLYG